MPRQSMESSKKIDAKPNKISKKAIAEAKGDGESRFHMISDTAYYRALGRGFNGGDPVEDWLMAEAEINGIRATEKQA